MRMNFISIRVYTVKQIITWKNGSRQYHHLEKITNCTYNGLSVQMNEKPWQPLCVKTTNISKIKLFLTCMQEIPVNIPNCFWNKWWFSSIATVGAKTNVWLEIYLKFCLKPSSSLGLSWAKIEEQSLPIRGSPMSWSRWTQCCNKKWQFTFNAAICIRHHDFVAKVLTMFNSKE